MKVQAVAAFVNPTDGQNVAADAIVDVSDDLGAQLKALGIVRDPPTIDPNSRAGLDRLNVVVSGLGLGTSLLDIGEHIVARAESAYAAFQTATNPADTAHWHAEATRWLAAAAAFVK